MGFHWLKELGLHWVEWSSIGYFWSDFSEPLTAPPGDLREATGLEFGDPSLGNTIPDDAWGYDLQLQEINCGPWAETRASNTGKKALCLQWRFSASVSAWSHHYFMTISLWSNQRYQMQKCLGPRSTVLASCPYLRKDTKSGASQQC